MKTEVKLLVAGAVLGLAFPAYAQDAAVAGQPQKGVPVHVQAVSAVNAPVSPAGNGSKAHERFNQKYDKALFDKISENDGYISFKDFSENASARDTLGGRVTPEYLKKFDADGDGQLNLQEAKRARQDMWQRAAKRGKEFKENHPNATWKDVRDRYRDNHGGDNPGTSGIPVTQAAVAGQPQPVTVAAVSAPNGQPGDGDGDPVRDRYQALKEKHPRVAKRIANNAVEHPRAAKQVVKDAKAHPKARKTLYRDATNHPKAANWAAKKMENNQKDLKRAYRNSSDKEKRRDYRAAKKHHTQVKRHPEKARHRAVKAHRSR